MLLSKDLDAQNLRWLTVLMRVCHTSMKTGEEVLTRLAFLVQAGHSQSGMDNKAMAGVTKANVPPCRMGSLEVNSNNFQINRQSVRPIVSTWYANKRRQ